MFKRKHTWIALAGADGRLYGFSTGSGGTIPTSLDATDRHLVRYRPAILPGPVGLAPLGVLYNVGFRLHKKHKGPSQTEDATTAAFDKTGKSLWKIQPSGLLKGSSPVVAPNGALYAPFIGSGPEFAGLDIISPRGKQTYIERGTRFSAVALGPDRSIFALVEPENAAGTMIQALSAAGKLLWQRPLAPPTVPSLHCRCLMMGSQGSVYVSDGDAVASYDPSGRLLSKGSGTDGGALALAERADGALLIAGRHTLSAVTPTGELRWTAEIGATGKGDGLPTLTTDGSNKAYVGTADGVERVFSGDGTLLASIVVGGHQAPEVPNAILAPQGRLVVNGTDGTLRVYR